MLFKNNTRILLYNVLLLFILLSLGRSFGHYGVAPLDGDIAESVLPYPSVQKTFDDPTGIKTIINNEKHWGTNRFFSHYFLNKTFRKIPIFLQNFTNPIESIYLTSAIVRMAIQILILCLLSIIISGKFNIFSYKSMAITALLIPFFQTNGKYLAHEIGIMDKYVSYCFFYALPLIFLLLYYLPVFFELLHHKKIKMNGLKIILWAILSFLACFSGPLNSPIILITNLILFVYLFHKNWKINPITSFFRGVIICIKKIDSRYYFFLFPITFLALYFTFLGTYISAYTEIQLFL
jgi:hypothetical protein